MISGEDVSALLIKHFKTPHSYLKKVPKAPRRFRDDKAILYRGTTLVAASFESGLSAGSFKPLVLVTERPGTPYSARERGRPSAQDWLAPAANSLPCVPEKRNSVIAITIYCILFPPFVKALGCISAVCAMWFYFFHIFIFCSAISGLRITLLISPLTGRGRMGYNVMGRKSLLLSLFF